MEIEITIGTFDNLRNYYLVLGYYSYLYLIHEFFHVHLNYLTAKNA